MAHATGVLLIQLGTPVGDTPGGPSTGSVRRYLAEFLSDPRVLDMPALGRWLLLHGVILRTRPRQSAAAYRKIWTPEGSPLRFHSEALCAGVADRLGPDYRVELAMRYGQPAIADALAKLAAAGTGRVVVIPLFPQHSTAANASALGRCYEAAARLLDPPAILAVDSFADHPGFIEAQAALARDALDGFDVDHVLFSYHGVPERQVRRADPTGAHCLASGTCCDAICAANARCYRAQCFATTRALAGAMKLDAEAHSVSFQSRLGRTPWIQPFTDEVLPQLAQAGVRKLAVLCPSFVADCLETIEEIGIRAREQWREVGGEELRLVPCVNSDPRWVEAVAGMVRERAGASV